MLYCKNPSAITHLADGRLIVRYGEFLNPRDSGVDFPNSSGIFGGDACQISVRVDHTE